MIKRNSRYQLIATQCEINTLPSLTLQGQSQSVYDLFQKMVLGQYLPPSPGIDDYDTPTTAGAFDLDSVDDSINRVGLTHEEAFMLQNKFSNIVSSELEKSQKIPSDEQKAPSEVQSPPDPTPV